MKKTAFMRWIDSRLKAKPRLAREVDELVSEMKLESGRIKNVGVTTLVKYARAVGGSVTIKIEPKKHLAARRPRLRKAG